tara:strand:- start:3165 stop:3500 length:336 start_codon:yes stop_codon:yes gene_type:complete
MKAADLLLAAAGIVSGDRADQHGDMRECHRNIATMWNVYLAMRREPALPLTSSDVALMMTLLKIARSQNGVENADDLLDAAGYIGIASELTAPEFCTLADTGTTERRHNDA